MKQVTPAELDALLRITGDAPVVSVYLPIDRKTHPRAQYKTLFKNLARETLEGNVRPSVREDLERIRTWLDEAQVDTMKKGLVIFCSSPLKLFKTFQVGKSFPTRLVVNAGPYIRPILVLLGDLRRYGIVVLDRKKAKFYGVELGDIEKIGEVQNDTHRKVKEGGWAGLEQSRIARRIDNQLSHHVKEAANYLAQLDQGSQFAGLFLQGSVETLSEFKSLLESNFPAQNQKVLGTFTADSGQPRPETLDKCLKIIKQQFVADEQKAIRQLEQEAATGRLGCVGLEPTLEALNKKNVKTLVVGQNYSAPGFRCANCRSLTSDSGPCKYCGAATTEVADVVADAITEVARLGSHVLHVLYSPEFEKNTPVGCLLRFPFGGSA